MEQGKSKMEEESERKTRKKMGGQFTYAVLRPQISVDAYKKYKLLHLKKMSESPVERINVSRAFAAQERAISCF